MRNNLLLIASVVLVACSLKSAGDGAAENRWIDARLLPVLEAQEHRDTRKLCALLGDEEAVVREAAALAYASVQDSASIPCLLNALTDTSATVRCAAVFALGFVADSLTVESMAQHAMEERSIDVQRAYLSASFIAMQRSGLLKDANAILYFLHSSTGQDQVRAADALRRMPDTTVAKLEHELNELMTNEGTEVRQFVILAMRKLGDKLDRDLLRRIIADPTNPGERVNAIRVLGSVGDAADDDLFLNALDDHATSAVAMDQLRGRPSLDAAVCLQRAGQVAEGSIRIGLLDIALEKGDASVSEKARAELVAIMNGANSSYRKAEAIQAVARRPIPETSSELLALLRSDRSAPERMAAFQGSIYLVRETMKRSRFASPQAQYAQLGEVINAALGSGDAGLISAAAEELASETPEAIAIMLPAGSEARSLAALEPLRDLEARILMEQVVAKRDGLTPPAHQRPRFNHPIDAKKLRALKQGQQYRIITEKGMIIIATDVNECPGSSLAFDSLVVAGYYNGKAFHRMVPNFVAQGGCPRGDGYGGMPWTLRTEIGRTPFTAGSVGLASAGPDTESCQFFITHSATPHLDGRYTRFGSVVSGMDVVWKLQVGDVMTRVERID